MLGGKRNLIAQKPIRADVPRPEAHQAERRRDGQPALWAAVRDVHMPQGYTVVRVLG
jgi:hypothetical protein